MVCSCGNCYLFNVLSWFWCRESCIVLWLLHAGQEPFYVSFFCVPFGLFCKLSFTLSVVQRWNKRFYIYICIQANTWYLSLQHISFVDNMTTIRNSPVSHLIYYYPVLVTILQRLLFTGHYQFNMLLFLQWVVFLILTYPQLFITFGNKSNVKLLGANQKTLSQ